MLLELPLAALISSSLRHSAMDLMFLKAASLAPVQRSQIAWLTLLKGETSTACLLTVPALPILVLSSLGFPPVSRWMISKLCFTMRTVISFLPLLRPCIIRELHILAGPLSEEFDLWQLCHHGCWLLANVIHRDLFVSPVITHVDLSCRSESSNKSL